MKIEIGRFLPVDVHGFPLPVAPDTGHGLEIVGRIPVNVVEDQSRSSDKIQSHSARFTTQQENACPHFQSIMNA